MGHIALPMLQQFRHCFASKIFNFEYHTVLRQHQRQPQQFASAQKLSLAFSSSTLNDPLNPNVGRAQYEIFANTESSSLSTPGLLTSNLHSHLGTQAVKVHCIGLV